MVCNTCSIYQYLQSLAYLWWFISLVIHQPREDWGKLYRMCRKEKLRITGWEVGYRPQYTPVI